MKKEKLLEQIQSMPRIFTKPGQISKHLQCCVCLDIFKQPTRLDCGHTYCQQCIEGQINCPQCRIKIDQKNIGRDLIATRIINQLEVQCPNKYCDWKGPYIELENHYVDCDKNNDPEWMKIVQLKVSCENNLITDEINMDENLIEKIHDNIPKLSLFDRVHKKDPNIFQNLVDFRQKGQKQSQIVQNDDQQENSQSSQQLQKSEIQEDPQIQNQRQTRNTNKQKKQKKNSKKSSKNQIKKNQFDLSYIDDVYNELFEDQKDEDDCNSDQKQRENNSQQSLNNIQDNKQNNDKQIEYKGKVYNLDDQKQYMEYLILLQHDDILN